MLRRDLFTGPIYILVERGNEDEPTYEGKFSKFVQAKNKDGSLGVIAFSKKKNAVTEAKARKMTVAGFMQPDELCKFLFLALTLGPTHLVLDPLNSKGSAVDIAQIIERFKDSTEWNPKNSN